MSEALTVLDLRGVACPINFVRTKLALENLDLGSSLKVILDKGEPLESVQKSILEEGQRLIKTEDFSDKAVTLTLMRLN